MRNSRKLLFSVDHSQDKLLTNWENTWHRLLPSCKLLFTSSSYLPSLCMEIIMVYCHETYFSDQRLISIFNILLLKNLNNFKMHCSQSAILYRSQGFDKILKNPNSFKLMFKSMPLEKVKTVCNCYNFLQHVQSIPYPYLNWEIKESYSCKDLEWIDSGD